MKLAIFGATGPTGVLITQQALAEGHHVTVVARTPSKLTLRHENLKVLQGDVFELDTLDPAIEGQDAVVSSLGSTGSLFQPVRVYSVGMTNILAAMGRARVRRLVCITAGGTNPERDPNYPFFFVWIIQPLLRKLYDDMRAMEQVVMASDCDYTILRPPRLLNTPATGKVRQAPGAYTLPGGGTISRADLAAVVLQQLDPATPLRTAIAVAH